MINNNPFTPNFGQVPPILAGRDLIIQDVLEALDAPVIHPARTSIFIGARGSGKTTLLTYFAEEADQRGWISVNVACIPGCCEDIIQQATKKAVDLVERKRQLHLSEVSIGKILGLKWKNDSEQVKANWRSRISALIDELATQDIGLLITMDEVNPKLDEMIQIASVYQLLQRENRKVALLMAGLPSEVSSLLNDSAVSFLRRASQYHLTTIEEYEVRSALQSTIEANGKKIGNQQLQSAAEATDGFPYMMQLVGYRIWQQSDNAKTIDAQSTKKGIALAASDFETRVIRATIQDLSEGDLKFLKAMLPDDKESRISDIEKRLNQASGYISRYRARLLEQGIITAARRGYVMFALPGLREYLDDNA